VSRSEAPPAVKIRVPAGLTDDQVIKALQATVHRMRVEQGHRHHMETIEKMGRENAASKKLATMVEGTFGAMARSLVSEVRKVLDS
jgi:hypothetical protein